MTTKIKIILYIAATVSIILLVLGVVLGNISCDGDCYTIAHGGILDEKCDIFYLPVPARLALMISGGAGIGLVVIVYGIFLFRNKEQQ